LVFFKIVTQLLKIAIVIHISNNSHILKVVTKKLYHCKLPIKILCVHVSASGRKTGFGRLMKVNLVFCKIHGKYSS